MPYSPLLIKPMREELTMIGFEQLTSSDDVDRWMEGDGLGLLVVNSVCGCAAGMARPGVRLALEQEQQPVRLGTVFAGQDVEATAQVRSSYLAEIPPSSPCMALFRGKELLYFLPRHRIEGRSAEDVASDLRGALDEHTV